MTYKRPFSRPRTAAPLLVAGALLLMTWPATAAPTPTKTRPKATKAPAARAKAAPPTSRPIQRRPAPPKAPGLQGKYQAKPADNSVVLGKIPAMFKTALQRRSALQLSRRKMAVDLYHKMTQSKGNVVFSPLSIGLAMSMVYAGARGKTAVELYRFLRLSMGGRVLHIANGEQLNHLKPPPPPIQRGSNPKPPPSPFVLNVASRMWGQRGFPFYDQYKQLLGGYYESSFATINFKKPAAAVNAINQWVAKATRQKIKRLLSPSSVQASTRLILTNAVYFKSSWKDRFHKSQTKPRSFWLTTKRSRKVATMNQKNWFSHKTTNAAHVVRLDYNHGTTAMYLVIPKQKAGLAAIEKGLDHRRLQGWFQGLKRRYLDLSVPKFNFKSKFSLGKVLKRLGVKTAFNSKANFKGISKQKVRLSEVIHQACLDVHEKGSEAAAATAVTFFLTGLPPKPPPAIVVSADRPFLFVLRHEATGTLLFMGRVKKP